MTAGRRDPGRRHLPRAPPPEDPAPDGQRADARGRTLAELPNDVKGEARDTVLARRHIASIPRGGPEVRVAEAAPADELRAHYAEPSALRHPLDRLLRSTSSSPRSGGSAARAKRAPGARCSSCPPPGRRTARAGTSKTRTTRSSPRRGTSMPRRAARSKRCTPTTTRWRTSERSAGSPDGCARRTHLPHLLRLAGVRPHAVGRDKTHHRSTDLRFEGPS